MGRATAPTTFNKERTIKMRKIFAVIAALMAFMIAMPAQATVYKFRAPAQFTETLGVTGILTGTAANVLAHSSSGCRIYNPAGTFYVTLTPAAEAANRVLSIPLLGAADTIMTLGTAQTVSGVKTFSAAPLFNSAVGATFKGTSYNANVIALAGLGQATVLTIPDPGAATADFVLSAGASTLAGVRTFSSAPVLSTATITSSGDTITIPDLGNANVVQSATAHTAALASTAAQLDSYTVCVDMADAGTAQSVFVVCPFAGAIQNMYAVNDVANTTTKTVFTAEIGGTLVTTAAAWEQGVTDAIGTVTSASCTATNVVTAGQALEVISDGGSASANQATHFVVVIKRQ